MGAASVIQQGLEWERLRWLLKLEPYRGVDGLRLSKGVQRLNGRPQGASVSC